MRAHRVSAIVRIRVSVRVRVRVGDRVMVIIRVQARVIMRVQVRRILFFSGFEPCTIQTTSVLLDPAHPSFELGLWPGLAC